MGDPLNPKVKLGPLARKDILQTLVCQMKNSI